MAAADYVPLQLPLAPNGASTDGKGTIALCSGGNQKNGCRFSEEANIDGVESFTK